MTGRLDGKVALITGAGSGMGREACAVFASEGAGVAAVDIDPELLSETEAAVRATDGEIASFVADVAVENQVRDAVEGAVERFGALHVLYNNAGVLWRDRDVSVLETDEEVWDRVFAINLKGMVWVCKYGIPHLIAGGGGAVVNVGSTSALLGDTIPQDAYTASKGAVISLTRNLAVQFGPQGIRANCIHPGFTDTPMQTVRTTDPAWVEAATAEIPLGRLATARDIVNAALFLASDEAAYVTGTELVVDGGGVVFSATSGGVRTHAGVCDTAPVAKKRVQFRPPGLKPTTKVGTLGPYRGRLGLPWVIAPLVAGIVILLAGLFILTR